MNQRGAVLLSLLVSLSPLYGQQAKVEFGVATIQGEAGFLGTEDPGLKAGQKILLITEADFGHRRAIQGVVTGGVEACELLSNGMVKGPYYSLRLVGAQQEGQCLAIGLVNAEHAKLVPGDELSVQIGGGRGLYFRHCTSAEALHLTVWSGPPLKGTRLWHRYFYLGYDTEPNCTESDYTVSDDNNGGSTIEVDRRLVAPGAVMLQFGRRYFKTHRSRPMKHWVEAYRDANSGEAETWHIEVHRGHRFEYIGAKGRRPDDLGTLVISDPSIKLPLGLTLGDAQEKVLGIMGKPAKKSPELFEYEVGGPALPDLIRFRFTRDHLIEVELGYEHD